MDKINDKESTEKNINNESPNLINEIKTNKPEEENQNKIILNEEKKPLPDYYKNFVRVKFDYGEGWILKSKVKKYNGFKVDENNSKKNKKK